jgi:hypothetical protein
MKLAMALAAAFVSACAGSAAGPSTPPPPPGPGVAGPARRALTVAAVVLLAARGGDGGPTQAGVADGSIRGAVADNTGATVANAGSRPPDAMQVWSGAGYAPLIGNDSQWNRSPFPGERP